MRLVQFQVKDFRSVDVSGWLTVDDVTALIGVNESGKTNLLLPLWKLNPAREGAIEPTSDYPKPKFGEIRSAPGKFWFIEADFELQATAEKAAALSGLPLTERSVARVRRFFDGAYTVGFPEHEPVVTVPAATLGALLATHRTGIDAAMPLEDEGPFYNATLDTIDALVAELGDGAARDADAVAAIGARLAAPIPEEPGKTSAVVPLLQKLIADLDAKHAEITVTPPHARAGVTDTIVKALPKFVYYSNYGNLDSEIYLPHVVQNLERHDLGSKEAAKARTLRVLFSFVRLSAQEILDLGSDTINPEDLVHARAGTKKPARRAQQRRGWFSNVQVTLRPGEKDLDRIAEQKRTRSILLQSAGTELTRKFKDWWQQGNYRFRFEADGNFFRIWVSDARRPAEVELENRSTGLQWFLSFYLVFLVESEGEHRDAVLLLDEPGVSLHPLAQRDLSAFFDQLGKTNQILYTSHSPFLVEADRLDRARKVYVSADGTTKVTAQLGGSEGTDTQKGAAYAVQSSLNLSVAEGMVQDCRPVLVDARSDQHYLTTIKTLLLSQGRITPARELVFAPSGGTQTAHIIANILTGRDDALPMVLLDSDAAGVAVAQALREGIYAEHPDRVLDLQKMIGVKDATIEDLFPAKFLAEEMDRIERTAENRLFDGIRAGAPFVAQVEAWAAAEGLRLDPAWQIDLALRAKRRALQLGLEGFDTRLAARWVKLFEVFG